MANIGNLVVSLEARTQNLETALSRTQRQLKDARRTIERLGGSSRRSGDIISKAFGRVSLSASGLRTSIVALSRSFQALIAIAATGFLARFITQTIAATDELGKFARRLNIDVELLQELDFAASQSGISQGEFRLGLQRLQRRAQDAAAGNKQLAESFRAFNVQLTDSSGRVRSTGDLLLAMADGFQQLRRTGEDTVRTFEIFDRGGIGFANLLSLTSQGIEQLRQRARELGIVLSRDTFPAIADANDRLDILQRVIRIQLTRAVILLTPSIIQFSDSFTRIVVSITKTSESLQKLTVLEQSVINFFDSIVASVKVLITVLGSIRDVSGGITRFLTNISNAFKITDLELTIQSLESFRKLTPRQEELLENLRSELRIRKQIREEVRQGTLKPPPAPPKIPAPVTPPTPPIIPPPRRAFSFTQELRDIDTLAEALDKAGIEFDVTAAKLSALETQLRQAVTDPARVAKGEIAALTNALTKLRQAQDAMREVEQFQDSMLALFDATEEMTQQAEKLAQSFTQTQEIDQLQRALANAGIDFDATSAKIELLQTQIRTALTDQVGTSTEHINALILKLRELQGQAVRAGEDVTRTFSGMRQAAQSIIESTRTPFENFQRQFREIDRLRKTIDPATQQPFINDRQARVATERIQVAFFETTIEGQALIAVTESISSAFQNTFEGIARGTLTASEGFRQLGQTILASLANTAIRTALNALSQALLISAAGAGGGGAGAGAGGSGGGVAAFGAFGLQHGGLVTRPTFAMVGEAGPEVVLPLDQLEKIQPTVSIINVPNMREAEQVKQREESQGRRVIINLIDQEIAQGDGSQLVQRLRRVLR